MTKYALCVGINAYGGANTLQGCVNDALDWQEALVSRGFQVATLIDSAATGMAIRDALIKAMSIAKYGDRFVFTYSGHGTYLPDANGDESDHQDEAIVPVDFNTNGLIVDDEIRNLLGNRKYGVRAVQVSDSCFSGSVSRFIGQMNKGTPRLMHPAMLTYTTRESTPRPRRSLRAALYPHLLMSGCSDTEYSYDAWFGNRANGAFTRVALDALASFSKDDNPTYQQWHAAIRHDLPSDDYPQTPLLDGSYTRRHWRALS